jgi:fatty-acyl-CoA synthase
VDPADFFAESCRFAARFLERRPRARHVAVLLDNTPDYLFAFGGAALIGGAIVGLNHTRRDEHLLRDVKHTHCGLVITEPRHEALLAPIADGLPTLLSSSRFVDGDDPPSTRGESLADALLPHADEADPGLEPDIDSIWALIFTSGTSDAPKAVICSQRRLLVTGKRMSMIMDLNPDDIGYVCMPLFHSNAVQVGWAPSLVVPCAVGLGRRFSASGWLPDIGDTARRTSYTASRSVPARAAQRRRRRQHAACVVRQRGSPEVVEGFRASVSR